MTGTAWLSSVEAFTTYNGAGAPEFTRILAGPKIRAAV